MMYLLANLKSHITISVIVNVIIELLPIKPSMACPMKYSLTTLGFFRSCGLKESHAKSVCVHMLRDTCHPVPDNLTNEDSPPDNDDIALASMKSWGK